MAMPERLILWNKLGSESEVTSSAFGPDLFFGDYEYTNHAFVDGIFGDALTIGPGKYYCCGRYKNAVLPDVGANLNEDAGAIEIWFKMNSEIVDYDHGIYRIFDGVFGTDAGIWIFYSNIGGTGVSMAMKAETIINNVDHIFAEMDDGRYGFNLASRIGEWVHLAAVWDRAGIEGSDDTMRFYVDNVEVADAHRSDWVETFGAAADIGGGNDQNIAGQFAVDNLKIWNYAKTDFSDRFVEGFDTGPFAVSLVNTTSDEIVATIGEGRTIDPDTAPTRRSISVDYAPGDAGSVTLELFDSAGRLVRKAVENVAPYALFGDTAGDFLDPTAPLVDDAYTLRLTAHARKNGQGGVLDTDTLAFTLDEDEGSEAVTISARVAVDGVQRPDRKLDTLQSGADDDIEAGGGYTGGFLFRDVAIPDGAAITAASIALVAERGRGAGTLDIRLSDDASNAGLSGTGALTKPGFDRFDPVAFALPALDAGDQVETPDLAALVGAVVARDPQADGTYDLLFAFDGPSLRFFEPEEFGKGAVLTLTYETDALI